MTTTIKKRRVVIAKIEVNEYVNFSPIEIRLPSHATKITGVMVTARVKTWGP